MEPEDVYSLAIRVEEGDISRQEFRRRLNESENFYTEGRTTDPLVYQGIDTDTTVEFHLNERKVEVYTGDMERFREQSIEARSGTPDLPPAEEEDKEEFSEMVSLHLDLDARESGEVVRQLEDGPFERTRQENPLIYEGEAWSVVLYMTDDTPDRLEVSREVEDVSGPYDEVMDELEDLGTTVALSIGEDLEFISAQDEDSFIDLDEIR